MTITPIDPPNINPFPVSGFPTAGFPITDITPLTYRDGVTYLFKMEQLRRWVQVDLVTWLTNTVNGLDGAWTQEVTDLVNAVNTSLVEQAAAVNTALSDQSTQVNTALQTEHDWVTEQIQAIIDNSISANDTVVSELINNVATLTRQALDALYQKKDTVADAAVAALITAASQTRTALDQRYVLGSALIDVSHGGTGRNTGGTANGIVAVGTTAAGPQQTIATGTAGQFLKSAGAGAPPAMADLIVDGSAATGTVYSSSKTQGLYDAVSGNIHLSGLYSARPAFSAVKAGTVYYATDVQEIYRASGVAGAAGTAWVPFGPGGAEVGYAQTSTATTTPSDGTIVDIAGLSITVVHGERPLMLEFQGIINASGAGTVGSAAAGLVDVTAGNVRLAEGHVFTMQSNVYSTLKMATRISGVTPGTTKTYKATINRTAAATGTVTVLASATYPPYIRAVTA